MRAVARPMPEVAPVITTTCSCSGFSMVLGFDAALMRTSPGRKECCGRVRRGCGGLSARGAGRWTRGMQRRKGRSAVIPTTMTNATCAAPRLSLDHARAGTSTARSRASPATRATGPSAESGLASTANPAMTSRAPKARTSQPPPGKPRPLDRVAGAAISVAPMARLNQPSRRDNIKTFMDGASSKRRGSIRKSLDPRRLDLALVVLLMPVGRQRLVGGQPRPHQRA